MNAPFSSLRAARIAGILRDTAGASPLPPRADRAAWGRLGCQSIAAQVIAKAEAHLADPVPPLPLSLYLDYQRTGRRAGYETPLDARRDRLTWMALAECLEGQGRFVGAAQDLLDAILREPTWVVPAHGAEFIEGLPMPDLQVIDLWSAMACLLLAEVDHMLGDALHPVLRKRLRAAVDARGIQPLLARDDMRWMGARDTGRSSPNWAPVCAGLTAGAAIHLEPDTDRLAAVLARALRELDHYLASFPADGGCGEGVGYWEKGVFAYACFADLVAARTDGRIDPMADPRLRAIALFPARVQLGPQRYPLFSDNVAGRTVQTALLRHLAHRLDLPALVALDPQPENSRRHTTRYPAEQIRDFLWWRDAVGDAALGLRDWLPATQMFVARRDPADPAALVVAAKAGTNGEPHNHNDVGSFVIALAGVTPVAEIGAGPYIRQTFDPAHRYTLPNYGAHGHSVPLVNGHAQAVGTEFAARDVTCDGDTLRMDLAGCYPSAAAARRVARDITLDRTAGCVRLTDVAHFDAPGMLVSAIITAETPERQGPGACALGPLVMTWDPGLVFDIAPLPPVITRDGATARFTRLTVAPADPAPVVRIALTFHPRPPSSGDRT